MRITRAALKRWFRPPRRLRVLRPGGFLIFGTFGLGLASLNTGNNLLYLLMGALLGTIALSGWLSEQALRELRIQRRVSQAITAGDTFGISYDVRNGKRRLPSHGIEILEIPDERHAAGSITQTAAFIPALEPLDSVRVRASLTAQRRGVYALDGVTLRTAFPFGLFAKERDIAMPATVTVWPRADRAVRAPRLGGRRGQRQSAGAGASAGAERGEYRGLRGYRPGDDPRDIHWRSTARRGEMIVREYDRDAADEYWIVLDAVAPDEETGEVLVEIAASVVAAAARRGDRFGCVIGSVRIPPGAAGGRVEAVLDLLAAVTIMRSGRTPALPAPAAQCVLVSTRAAAGAWGDVITPDTDAAA